MANIQSQLPRSIDDIQPQPEFDPPQEKIPSGINVAPREREISLLGGAGLVVFGLRRGTLGGLALAAAGAALIERGVTGHCHGYQLLNINTAKDDQSADPDDYFENGIHIETAMTIQRSPAELFSFWRNFENLPRFMKHLKSVSVLDDKKSRWVATAPAGSSVQWDAEIINEEKDRLIAWRSVGGAEVDNAGSVRFIEAPGDRGTEVRVVMDYIPPAGRVGKWVAKLFGQDPETSIREDLRNFKSLMETGEIPTIQGQPKGTCGRGGNKRQSGV